MKAQQKFTSEDCVNMFWYLVDRTTTKQERKAELRKLNPVNMAIFCQWLDGSGSGLDANQDSVLFIEAIMN